MRTASIVLYELLLVVASVFIFRSLWMLSDRIPWMNQDSGIWGSFMVGIVLTVILLIRLNRMIAEKRDT